MQQCESQAITHSTANNSVLHTITNSSDNNSTGSSNIAERKERKEKGVRDFTANELKASVASDADIVPVCCPVNFTRASHNDEGPILLSISSMSSLSRNVSNSHGISNRNEDMSPNRFLIEVPASRGMQARAGIEPTAAATGVAWMILLCGGSARGKQEQNSKLLLGSPLGALLVSPPWRLVLFFRPGSRKRVDLLSHPVCLFLL
jgi:hypothetical protein